MKNKSYCFKNKQQENKEMIANQLKLFQKHKELQAEEKRRYEYQLVKELKQKIEEDKHNKFKIKSQQRQVYNQMMIDNDKLREEMIVQKQKERERDARYLEEYNRFIDRQDAERKNEKERRYSIIKQRMDKMGGVIANNYLEKERQHELRLLKNHQEKEAQQIQQEKKKKMEYKKYQKELRGFLAKQVEEKRKFQVLEDEK